MKYKFHRGLIYIPVKIVYNTNIISINSIIDTGSAGTAIDINLVKIDYQKAGQIKYIVGIGGRQEVLVQNVDEIQLSDKIKYNFPVEFTDIHSPYGIDGFIGTDLLDALDAVIDFEQKEFILK